MSEQENLKDYTTLDDFLQVLKKFVNFSSDGETWIYHPEKIERKHLLMLLAWPGIFTIRLASVLGKDEFIKEFELIEALYNECIEDVDKDIQIKLDKLKEFELINEEALYNECIEDGDKDIQIKLDKLTDEAKNILIDTLKKFESLKNEREDLSNDIKINFTKFKKELKRANALIDKNGEELHRDILKIFLNIDAELDPLAKASKSDVKTIFHKLREEFKHENKLIVKLIMEHKRAKSSNDKDKEELHNDILNIFLVISKELDPLKKVIKKDRDKERGIFKKALHTAAKLFKDEKDKDFRLENIRERFRDLNFEYWIEKLFNFVEKDDEKLVKVINGKIESIVNLFKELYEKNEKKYRNQIEKLIKKWIDIIGEDSDEHQLRKHFEEVIKLWTKLSKELLNQIKKISKKKQFEKRVLTLSVELIEQCLKLLKSFPDKFINSLNIEALNADYIKSLIDEQKIMIDGQTIDSTFSFDELLYLLFKEELTIKQKEIINIRTIKEPLLKETLEEYFKTYLYFSIPKSFRKLNIILLHIKHIDKQNIDELYYLFSNYYIIFYLFVYFYKEETKSVYISLDKIRISDLKDKIISFDPTKKDRYVRIADSDLKEIIENSNIEAFGKSWLDHTNSSVIDKTNYFKTHNKEITHLSSNHIPPENLFWTQENLFLHHIKTKEGSNFGIVNDKSEFDNNINYNSAVIAYDINTIRELDYNLWVIPHKFNDNDEKNIGYFFYTNINKDVNIDEILLKCLYYIVNRISSVAVTIVVDPLNRFFANPVKFVNKNLNGYKKWVKKLTKVYSYYEEFLRSEKLKSAVYKVNAELIDEGKVTEDLVGKLRTIIRLHVPADLVIILHETDNELNDIINNAKGSNAIERKDSAYKYWESKKFEQIIKKNISHFNFVQEKKSQRQRESRTRIFVEVAKRYGYTITGNMAFKALGLKR